MGYRRLGKQAQIPEEEALSLIKKRAALYPAYTAWSEKAVAEARNGIPLTSRLGWTLYVGQALPGQADNREELQDAGEWRRNDAASLLTGG